jgi:hypothetical protein
MRGGVHQLFFAKTDDASNGQIMVQMTRAYDRCDLGSDALNRCLGFRVMFWRVQNVDGILRCLRG